MNHNFKVGQKYRVNSIRHIESRNIIEITDIGDSSVAYTTIKGRGPAHSLFDVDGGFARILIPIQQKIVILTDGETTTAKLFDGKQVIKTAEAKCFSGDKFDFNLGATIALSRLTNFEKKVEPEKPSLLNTKICITEGDDEFKTGQIYKVVDGKIKQRDGAIVPYDVSLHSIEELKDYFLPQAQRKLNGGHGWSDHEIKFIEVIE